MERADVVVVGGGPAGSTAARALVRGGARVVLFDAASFPRVKLCAGWVNPAVFTEFDFSANNYDLGLWPWHRIFVRYRDRVHVERCHGYFIRRYEFDDFLLKRTGADLRLGTRVASFVREGSDWIVNGTVRAPYLVGAGGTQCVVARRMPRCDSPLVTAQEKEFEVDASSLRHARPGADGECELLLHGDLGGYSWLVPKGGWLNVGSGTFAGAILPAWRRARDAYVAAGRVPDDAVGELRHMKGHSYHLYATRNLSRSYQAGAFAIGDALGIAHPATGEGILPAMLTGRLCAETILAGHPERYPDILRAHALFRDYDALARLLSATIDLMRPTPEEPGVDTTHVTSNIRSWVDALLVRCFVGAFSGRPLPARPGFMLAGGIAEMIARQVNAGDRA